MGEDGVVERLPEGQVVPLDAFPTRDEQVPAFLAAVGVPGIVDVHVHAMPDRLQQAVWRYFGALEDPPWPIPAAYRGELDDRLARLRDIGVVAHTALAYAHRPGMLGWLNGFTLDLAERHPQVVPTFTIYPEDGVTEHVAAALERGGAVCKVHTQLSRYLLDDPRLDDAWELMAQARTLVVAHTSAVYGVDGGHETSGGAQVFRLREKHPGVRLVLAHLGLPDPDGTQWDAIETLDGVWTDPSMVLTDPPPAVMAGSRVDLPRLRSMRDRVLFGSDFPSVTQPYAAQVRGLAALELDPAGLRAVLHDRTAALLAEAGWTRPAA